MSQTRRAPRKPGGLVGLFVALMVISWRHWETFGGIPLEPAPPVTTKAGTSRGSGVSIDRIRLVWHHYLWRAGDDLTAWPAVATVAAHCGIPATAVRRALRTLEAQGRMIKRGRVYGATRYELVLPVTSDRLDPSAQPVTSDHPNQSPVTGYNQSHVTIDPVTSDQADQSPVTKPTSHGVTAKSTNATNARNLSGGGGGGGGESGENGHGPAADAGPHPPTPSSTTAIGWVQSVGWELRADRELVGLVDQALAGGWTPDLLAREVKADAPAKLKSATAFVKRRLSDCIATGPELAAQLGDGRTEHTNGNGRPLDVVTICRNKADGYWPSKSKAAKALGVSHAKGVDLMTAAIDAGQAEWIPDGRSIGFRVLDEPRPPRKPTRPQLETPPAITALSEDETPPPPTDDWLESVAELQPVDEHQAADLEPPDGARPIPNEPDLELVP